MRLHILAAAAVLIAGSAAFADPAPTAEDIINSLKPNPTQLKTATRGIRPASMTPAASTPASPRTEAPSISLTVNFPSGSATLTPGAARSLNALGHALASNELSGFRFRVEGHTDTVGKPEENKSLSQQRAEAVAAYLEKKFSIDAGKLEAVGVGSENLLVETPDQTAEPKNRAVKIVNLGA